MDFYAILDQVVELLRRRGRVTYRALQLQFQLDDEALEVLRDELIKAQHVAVDEQGDVLVWTGGPGTTVASVLPASQPGQPSAAQAAGAAPGEAPPAAPRTPEAERRQLTVLFCDLVESTGLAHQLDPEELREVVRAYQAAGAEVVQRFDGHIAQYLGDGLLVYFGYPLAHEDDAPRAVRTGLGILQGLHELNVHLQRERGIRLAVRVGIHTGLVVVGEVGGGARHEQLALGETPNVAARLQGLAEPDTVVISAATYRLVQGVFACQAMGRHTLKGLPQPVAVYRVLSEGAAQSHLEAAAPSGLTPLVGREQEVGLLLERWAQVKEGLGQVVVLSGEAGIGKSRLVQVVKERVADEPHLRWECRCSPYYQNSALYPVIDLLQRALQVQRDETAEEKLGKLEQALAPYPIALSEVVPLFAALLSLPLPARYPPLSLAPARQKQKTLEAVLGVLGALVEQQPLLLIVEDLHWVDASTVELLSLLIDQTPTARILTLLTGRPEFQPPWPLRAHLSSLTLSRLPRPQVEVMVERVTGGKVLPAEVRQQVVAKTDGVPLFVEELTKMVLESGLLREREGHYELTGPLPPLAIPATLQDSLMARLDRLATVKEVAQLAATLGRAFPYEVLRAVTGLDDGTLQQALVRLVEAELLYQRGVPPQATYLFKHALIQETAYQSLLRSTRQQFHQRIAQVLEAQFPDIAEAQPELLAQHYTGAGLGEQAVVSWQRAGQRAIQRSANVEAIGHLTQGLEVLNTCPAIPERLQHELDVQIALGQALSATRGYGAPEVEQAYTRAQELCQRVGETPRLFPALSGLWFFDHLRAEFTQALEAAASLLTLAEREQDRVLQIHSRMMLGGMLFHVGECARGQAHLEQGIAFYDPQQHRTHAMRYVQDFGISCWSYVRPLWLLGYPDQALQRKQKALTLAQELAHPFTLAYTLTWAATVHQFRREVRATHERAEALIALSTEKGFALWETFGTVLRGWALVEQGRREEGLAQMRHGIAAWRGTGTEIDVHYFLALLAEAHAKGGQVEEGLALLAEALVGAHKYRDVYWEPEVHRLRGELLLQQAAGNNAEAEACFHQALDVARRQQAKSLELRTAMSLSRLWQRQGQRAAAHALLAPIYGWFTEGFDTADLQDAKALLEELA